MSISRNLIPSVLDHHARIVAAGGSQLRKNAPESAVTIVEMEQGPLALRQRITMAGIGTRAQKGSYAPLRAFAHFSTAGSFTRRGSVQPCH